MQVAAIHIVQFHKPDNQISIKYTSIHEQLAECRVNGEWILQFQPVLGPPFQSLTQSLQVQGASVIHSL